MGASPPGGKRAAGRAPWPGLRPRGLRLRGAKLVRFPAVMGVLNVTPDSFSDGGRYFERTAAVEHGLEMADKGADIIDVGGESTRPGAREVPVELELERVIPVIRELSRKLAVPISVDTRKAVVADAALAEGAAIVNDVSGLSFDPLMARTVAGAGAAVVLMHMRGVPETMMRYARYRDVVAEVRAWLKARARLAKRAGVPGSKIVVDPGLGFAKTAGHNLRLLASLPRLCALGYPVMIGASRKSFVRKIAGAGDCELALGSAAVSALAVAAGASIVRVHDPDGMGALVRMAAAVAHAAAVTERA